VAIRLICRDGSIDQTFTQSLVTIGRGPGNTVRVENAQVSGIHGQIVLSEGVYWYHDLKSTNGSLVENHLGSFALDGQQQRSAPLSDGARLVLGDQRAPVVFEVVVVEDEAEKDENVPRTVIVSRSIAEASRLSVQMLTDSASSHGRLKQLLALTESLQAKLEPSSIADQLIKTIFASVPLSSVAGVYFESEKGLVPVLLRARKAAEPLALPWQRVGPLFLEAVQEQRVVQVEDERSIAHRFERAAPSLRAAVACPLVEGDVVKGVLVVASPERFNESDVDWIALLGWQVQLALRNAKLFTELEGLKSKLEEQNSFLRRSLDKETHGTVEIVGESAALKRTLKQVEIVARTDTTVLVLGETGTGKELVARMLHDKSPRAAGFFAAVNCGALTETLLESELFGHVRGAFTGASRDKKGLFEVADGGTLFLDEFGDVSPRLQVKLLRVLENGEVTPVGAVQSHTVDVRIVAATNRDLKAEVEAKRFREDLYYRINVFPLQLPPLRERLGDVERLCEHFLARFNERFKKSLKGFSRGALERLQSYGWPGNVRELQNELERVALLAEDHTTIGAEDLSERIVGAIELPTRFGALHETMEELEARYIRRVLARHDYNRTQSAKTLGISRQALTAKLHKNDLIDLK